MRLTIGKCSIAALAMLALPSTLASAAGLAELAPDIVAQMVDVRSFPSSIGPRQQGGLRTFADYGFTKVAVADHTAELYEEDRSWMFAVTILDASETQLTLCIVDRALGGPTYHSQKALVFTLSSESLLVATDADVQNDACPPLPPKG